VQKGATQQFTANVTAAGGASTAVTWTVTGKTSSSTGISTAGLLTVAANETATALTVTATSTFDQTKKGTAQVTVTNAPVTPSVTSVTVSPDPASVQKGATQQFTASVTAVGGASTAVTWTVTGNALTSTAISPAGLLTVAAEETATSLTVTATSEFDNTKKGTAQVTVEGVTGVPELDAPDLKVYPNPFTDALHLTGADGCTLQVINAAGVVVHTQKIVNPDETIRLEHLPAGVYFFRIEKDGRAKTLKVIKN
jgi:hypothetical protein